MKIIVISDIHAGETRVSTTHGDVIRQANTQALTQLTKTMPYLNQLEASYLVHLGDALRDVKNPSTDQSNLLATLKQLQTLNIPQLHLLGNHEQMAFERNTLTTLYHNTQIPPEFQGHQSTDGFNLIWLDFVLDEHNEAWMSDSQLAWLEQIPVNQQPSIVFSHYSLVALHPRGSFYFSKNPKAMGYQNAAAIRAILAKKNVRLCINAHVHFLSHQIIDGVHYISNPAFSENIAGSAFPDNNPGVYSLLEITDTHFDFLSFSETYAFAQIRGEL